jgi:hypothetical protein
LLFSGDEPPEFEEATLAENVTAILHFYSTQKRRFFNLE